jgi:stringent starvation protein B
LAFCNGTGVIIKQETKQKRNETKRDTTETKQDKAETKRDTTETKQDKAETKPNETKRDTTETKRGVHHICGLVIIMYFK